MVSPDPSWKDNLHTGGKIMGAGPVGLNKKGIARSSALALVVATVCSICCVGTTPPEKPLEQAGPATTENSNAATEDFDVSVEVPREPILGNRFDVRVRVVNRSKTPQSNGVMTCSMWDNWTTKSDRLYVEPRTCFGNFVQTVELKPGGVYEDTITLTLNVRDESTTEAFRMGFTSRGGARTYWSNPLIVRLKAPESPAHP
jgi:hypothetical protein